MTGTQRVGMSRQHYIRLHNELAALRSQRSIEVPDDLMDYDANLIGPYSARRRRIHEIEELLTNAVVDADAVGDGIAEPGMVLTIRYNDTGETETFLLGRRGAPDDAAIKVYSMASPLGRAIAGARPGEQRIYSTPDGTYLLVTLLKAVPYQKRHREKQTAANSPGHAAQLSMPTL